MCLSPYVETFNSKVIKRFRTWTNKSLRVYEFRDSYVLYVYMLPTCHVYFAHGHIRVYGYLTSSSIAFLVYPYFLLTLGDFFIPALVGSLSLESEWLQVFLCLLDSSQHLGNDVVRVVSFPPLVFNSCSPLTKPFGTFPLALTTNSIIVTLMLHRFFTSQVKTKHLSIVSLFLNFYRVVRRKGKLIKDGIRWFVFIDKSQRILWVWFYMIDSGVCIHHLVVWSKFSLLHNSQVDCLSHPIMLSFVRLLS